MFYIYCICYVFIFISRGWLSTGDITLGTTHGTQGPTDIPAQHVSGWRIGDALSKSTMLFPRHNHMIDGVMVSGKGAIQGPFHQNLVAIGPVVSEEKIFMWTLSYVKLSSAGILWDKDHI